MEAGRDLDLLIAEKFFGLCVEDTWTGKRTPVSAIAVMEHSRRFDRVPHFSTDIAAAWKVVEWMRYKSGIGYLLELHQNGSEIWVAEFAEPSFKAEGHSAPHAICLAALKAVNAI